MTRHSHPDTPRCDACEEDLAREDVCEGHGCCWSCREGALEKETSGRCEKCGCELNGEAAHIESVDEVWCHSCADNVAEAAWERHMSDFHDGGNISFKSLQDQQTEARRLK